MIDLQSLRKDEFLVQIIPAEFHYNLSIYYEYKCTMHQPGASRRGAYSTDLSKHLYILYLFSDLYS